MFKKAVKYVFVICLVLLSGQRSAAQGTVRFKNFTVKDGLSMGTITAFAQDDKGFMWIATAEGLHRFDGSRFKIFKHEEGNSNSLTDSYITSLLVKGDRLFIGTHSGIINVLDLDNYKFTTIKLSLKQPKFDFPIVKLSPHDKVILVSTLGGGLWEIDVANNAISKLSLGQSSGYEIVFADDKQDALLLDRDSIFKLSNSRLTYKYSANGREFTTIQKYKQDYLLGTTKGLYRLGSDFKELEEVPLPPKRRRISHITDIAVNGEQVWVGTMGGLVNLYNGNMSHYYADEFKPYSLVNNQITSVYLGKNGIVWSGTIAGLSMYDPNLQKFNLLQYFDYQQKSYSNNVYCVYEDKQHTIWLGTLSSGLIRLNNENEIDKVYEIISAGDYESKAVRSLLQDSKNRFWIGTRDAGLFLLNTKTDKFIPIANTSNGQVGSDVIRCIFEDSDKNIWIGAQDGLYLLDSITNRFIHYPAEEAVINNSVYQITENPRNGELIIASFRGGLQIFDRKAKKFRLLKHDEKNAMSLNNNNIMSLSWLNSDTLLIGTYGGGLNIFSLHSETFTHITEEDGLVNNAVYGILHEGKGICWLSTNDGLVRYDLRNNKFKNFKPIHYLQSTEFNEGAFCKTTNGVMYFGGVNGLNYFKPSNITYNKTPLSVYLTDVRGKHKQNGAGKYTFDYLDSRLEIDFVATAFSNPQGILYEYKLEGHDKEWIKASGLTAVYPKLNPGTYVFSVKVTDEFGFWQNVSDEIKIIVQPPFWQRWWFISLMILALGLAVYAIFRFRTREIARTYKMQIIDSELLALRSQMNPHFIFNSLNSIQYYILKKQPIEAYSYLSKFASLMRKILQNSRLKQISVADEVEWLTLYLELEKLRMDNELDYKVTLLNIDDSSAIFMPTMLLQPFVENSIVHGLLPKSENRELRITLEKQGTYLLCTIHDNGIGRKASAIINEQRNSNHKSSGMDLTNKRLEILNSGNKKYEVLIEDLFESDKPQGTKVELKIPILTEKD